jgi:hypothetical protein
LFLSCGVASGSPAVGEEPAPLRPARTDEEIAVLIRDLGDPSYEKRTQATRRLCAIGTRASQQLKSASQSENVETALRARQLLTTLDRLWFTDVQVSLAFSKAEVAWNEPVDLLITLINHGEYPARVPFEIDPHAREAGTEDARQVGDMLDAAEWLRIRAEDKREIDIRVDDILFDPAVTAAVQARLNGGPSSVIEAGQKLAVEVRDFNRGWARYPLLDRGTYKVVLDYTPEWDDVELQAQNVGRVRSNEAFVTVTGGAPESVSRGSAEAAVAVEREGASLVARLTNRTDQPMLVNTNFGAPSPFAAGKWVFTLGDTNRAVPVLEKRGPGVADFDAGRLVSAQPGDSAELARIGIAELRKTLTDMGVDVAGDRWTIHFAYASVCNRQWQAQQGSQLLGNDNAPQVLREPLSRRLYFGRLQSEPLAAPKAN